MEKLLFENNTCIDPQGVFLADKETAFEESETVVITGNQINDETGIGITIIQT